MAVCGRVAAMTSFTEKRLVPSQFTERIQAEDVPEVWEDKSSLVYRGTAWYMARRWPAIALLVLGCAFFGAAIVAATYGWRVQ